MDKEELKDKIDIIFKDEDTRRRGGRSTKDYSWKDKYRIFTYGVYEGYKKFPPQLPDVKDIQLNYDNLELLLKLYDSIKHSSDLENYFINYLMSKKCEKYICLLVYETLIRLGNLNKLLSYIYYFDLTYLKAFFTVLDELLYFDYTFFSEPTLKKLKESVDGVLKVKFPNDDAIKSNTRTYGMGEKVLSRINTIFYKSLKQALDEGTNFQINIDRDKIKEKINIFGFDPILSEALDKIEDMYLDTTKDDFDNSMAIGHLRTFQQELIKSICKKIEEKSGEKISKTKEKESEMGKLRIYLKKHLSLDEEDKLMNIIVDIFNHKGSHNFISEGEYFRLTKNITIEIAYLLFIKLEKILQN